MLRTLNADYIDNSGKKFRVRVKKYHDAFSWRVGDFGTASMQTGLPLPEIYQELDAERPLFYASSTHAMVLVSARHTPWGPIDGWVLDPAPSVNLPGSGPITDPRIPAVGLRRLAPQEMTAWFIATVEVTALP
jgi:hypothetical protein